MNTAVKHIFFGIDFSEFKPTVLLFIILKEIADKRRNGLNFH
jgi:hypothetical protein